MNETNTPSKGFKIIAILAIIWNVVGILFWLMEYFLMDAEMKASLPPEQLEMMNNAPSWGMWVYAIAVFVGTLASILLLMRKKISILLFLISLLAILIQMGYWIIGMDAIEILGIQSIFMPLMVIAIAIFLFFYSKSAARKGWLS